MKKSVCSFLCFILAALYGTAQDIISLKNGQIIEAKVTKVSSTEIGYKKWINPDGPTYTLETTRVASIKYENGREDKFLSSTSSNSEQSRSRITETASQAWNNYKNEEKSTDDKYLKKRHFRLGLHGAYGIASSNTDDKNEVALMGSISAWNFKASVEYFPNLTTGNFFYGGYLGIKGVETSSNFTVNGMSLDDTPIYFIVQPLIGFEYRQFYMKTGLNFDFLISDEEPYKSITNGCAVGWPFEIGWTKKFWEIGLFTNMGFSNMYKDVKSRPYEFGITFGIHY